MPVELQFLNRIGKPYRISYEPWAEVQLPPGNRGSDGVGKLLRGKHWEFPVIVPGAMSADAVWAITKPAFLNNGWTQLREWTAGGRLLWIHYQKNGVEAYAVTDDRGQERASVEVVELAPMPFRFALTPPAATPEPVSATQGEFPWLGPLPGSKFHHSEADPAPYSVSVKDAPQPELVANGSILKVYTYPEGLSNSLFQIAYVDALTQAGWTILDNRRGADVAITAHYTQHGRNIWANLHKNDGYDIRVADAGAATKDLRTELAKQCHVALYGVLFDFNKATLQAASDPVLEKTLGLLTNDPTLKLEIQGHTDNVGDDAYNRTLSEARAESVVTWLTQHGVAAARLSGKGFGKIKPVAENTTDAGRAKNRRVEIADPRCTPQQK